MAALNLSERSITLSLINPRTPCEIRASRSISPIRKPPPARFPEGGCLFLSVILPVSRALILSITICFKR